MKKVEFIKDFATKKSGDIASYDSILASFLVNKEKVAVYYTEKTVIQKKSK
jgi:hypothetical protein